MPGKHLNLIEKQQCKILKATGHTNHAIGKEIGRSLATVRSCVEEPSAKAEIGELKKNLADKFENLTERLLDSIDDSEVEKMSGYQRIVGAGISVDKTRLLRGEADDDQPRTIEIYLNLKREHAKLEAMALELEEGNSESKALPPAEDDLKPDGENGSAGEGEGQLSD